MKTLLQLFIILLTIHLSCINIFAEQPDISGKAAILIDEATGMVLYEKNADEKLYPASITKIMTAIVAIENGDLNQIMTASQSAIDDIGPDGMNIGILAGEQLRHENLLNAMLIKSANEAANIIAENLTGDRQQFIDMMNKKAKQIGTVNTNFVNASGIHHPDHYTTAADFAKIARYAMSIPKFREIVSKQTYEMPPTNMHKEWPVLYSGNKLLYRSSEYYTQPTGIKSGFTNPAGFNLVSSAIDENGTELISVIMGEDSSADLYRDSQALLEYGFRNFKAESLAEKDKVFKNINTKESGENKTLDLIYSSDLQCLIPNDRSKEDIKVVQNVPDTINSSVYKGQILGYAEFYLDDQKLGKVNILASRSVEIKSSASSKKASESGNNSVLKVIFKIFAILIMMFIILRLSLRTISRTLKTKKQNGREIFKF